MSDVADDEEHHLLGKAGRANLLETLNAQGPQGVAEFQEVRHITSIRLCYILFSRCDTLKQHGA